MTSEARIAASRANGQKSRGPISARGLAISSMNALRHGRRSKRMALVEDISYSYEERRRKWMARHDASNDVEEFIMSRCASMASKIERIERADAERFRTQIEKADETEYEEVLALGKRLFFNRCGSMGTYGLKPSMALKVKTSFSGQPLEPEEPFVIVGKMLSSETGTRYLLDTWDGLRARLEPGKFWQAPDRFQAVRLLGHQPIDVRFDDVCAAIFYASAKLERGKPEPFSELRSDLDADQLTELRKQVALRCPELAALEDQTECRQILLDIVDRNVERLEEILKTHEENADAEAERVVAREGFDTSPRSKQLNDYELKYDRAVRQSLVVYEKLTGGRKREWDAARSGEPGAPASFGTEVYQYGPGTGEAGGARNGAAAGGARAEDSAPSTSHAADGTRSVPATIGGTERGWDSVEVQAADVLACQGFLPERHTGAGSGTLLEDTSDNRGGTDPVRLPPSAACGDTSPTRGEECKNATNEPKISDDVLSLQCKANAEVTADLGGESGLDKIRTNPRRSDGRAEGGRAPEPAVARREEEMELRGRHGGGVLSGHAPLAHEGDAMTPALSRREREVGASELDPGATVIGAGGRAPP